MQHVSRFALSLLIAIATCTGAFALVGCGGSASSSAAPAASAQSASAEAASTDAASSAADTADDEEQDNCYGDDLPARKS